MLKRLIYILAAGLIAAGMTPQGMAQVQLGGHIFVPSTGDSNAGQTTVAMTDADCVVDAPAGTCTVTSTSPAPSNADAAWNGTLVLSGTLDQEYNLILPLSAGRRYCIVNNTNQPIQPTGATGTEPADILNGSQGCVYTDGTNYYDSNSVLLHPTGGQLMELPEDAYFAISDSSGNQIFSASGVSDTVNTRFNTLDNGSGRGTFVSLFDTALSNAYNYCLYADASGQILATGEPCGGGTVSGQAAGVVGLGGSATSITGQSHINENTPGFTTITQPVAIADPTHASQQTMTYNTGYAPSGTAGSAAWAPDSSGNFDISEDGSGFERVCDATNYTTVCPSPTPVTYPTGVLFGNGSSSAPTVATSSQVQGVIGADVYDPYGAAAAVDTYTSPLTGGVARTLPSKLGDIVSVKDFGAAGNGTTDDSTDIQAALNAVNSAGGGTVYFPAGTYVTTVPLLTYSNVVMKGAGQRATVIKKMTNTIGTYGSVVVGDGQSDNYDIDAILEVVHAASTIAYAVGVQDMELMGDGPSVNAYALWSPRTAQSSFSNLYIYSASYAFFTYDTWLSSLRNIYIDHTSYGIMWADDGSGSNTGDGDTLDNIYIDDVVGLSTLSNDYNGMQFNYLGYSSFHNIAVDDVNVAKVDRPAGAASVYYFYGCNNISLDGVGSENAWGTILFASATTGLRVSAMQGQGWNQITSAYTQSPIYLQTGEAVDIVDSSFPALTGTGNYKNYVIGTGSVLNVTSTVMPTGGATGTNAGTLNIYGSTITLGSPLSAALTSASTAPTAAVGTNTTQPANTAFVQAAVTAALGGTLGSGNVTVLADAGTGATASLTGLDGSHQLTITTGATGYTQGDWATVTFTASRGHNTYCVATPANTNASGMELRLSGGSATGYTASMDSESLFASTAFTWNISCP